jgi:hypothetical protein
MGFSDRGLMIRTLKAITQAAFPAFWTKKAHRMFVGQRHSICDENNVCAAVVEGSDGSRTADFQVWALCRSAEKEKLEPRIGRVIPVSSGGLDESFRVRVLVSVNMSRR